MLEFVAKRGRRTPSPEWTIEALSSKHVPADERILNPRIEKLKHVRKLCNFLLRLPSIPTTIPSGNEQAKGGKLYERVSLMWLVCRNVE